jgi:hypothetical protein
MGRTGLKIHKVCIDFVELNGAHSGENSAEVIFQSLSDTTSLKRLSPSPAIMQATANNDPLCRHLYAKL